MKLILPSFLIACPVAWWALTQGLQGFAYRTEMDWWIFGAAGIAAVLIVLVTVGSLAMRAAMANPVESLKSE